MGSLREEERLVKVAFKALLPRLFMNSISESTIMVTPAMIDLYEWAMDEGKDSSCIFIEGPPGLGKTTSLYWLYKQLHWQKVFPVLLPFDDLPAAKDSILSYITDNRGDRSIVMLLDLTSPSVGAEKRASIQTLVELISEYNCKLVIALSSLFGVFTMLATREATFLINLYLIAEKLTFKPFDNERAKEFLHSMGISNNVEELVKCCNGIPNLLSLCGRNDYRDAILSVQRAEFSTVIEYLANYHMQVDWLSEINILVAANLKIPVKSIGMSNDDAEQTVMCKSHLLRIENGIPIPYFPTIHDGFLSSQVKLLFTNMNRLLIVKTDANSVIGNFFEYRVPFLISRKDYRLTLEVQQLGGKSEKIVIELVPLQSADARLDSLTIPGNNTVWRTPKDYKAIDYIVRTEVKFFDSESPIQTILAMQATVQAKNQKQKIEKSVVGLPENIRSQERVILVLINPLWTDFITNYELAQEAILSCATRSGRGKFSNLWYGQPSNFDDYKCLHQTLCNVFMP